MSTELLEKPADYLSTLDGQFLTFSLSDESYGIAILQVQEIRGYAAVTRMPNTPAHVKGVINLRGSVVPIVDLRTLFGLPESPRDQTSVIIVVNIGPRVAGLVVDGVSDVLTVGAGDVEPPPELGGSIDLSVITGLAKDGERLVTLIDVTRLVAHATQG